jgi:hypothetical protein
MPKQSNSRNENKGVGHGGQGAGRGERGGNGDEKRQEVRQDRVDKMNDAVQQARQDRSAQVKNQQRQNREIGSGKVEGLGAYRKLFRRNREESQGKGLTGAAKKNGCLPKLFMLVLPIMAVGTYLFLWS